MLSHLTATEASNIDKDTLQILISKLIDSNVITIKKTKLGQQSLFVTKDATAIPTKDNAVGTNDIWNHANHENVAHSIINIGLDCKNNDVKEVLTSYVSVKKNRNLTAIVRRVNDMLRDLCEKNGFSFICNDVITTNYLWKDGLHLQDMGTHIISNHFLKFLDYSIDSSFDNCLWLNDSPQTNVSSDIKGLIDLRKRFPYNLWKGYINISSLKEKVIPLREILSNAPMDVLCVDETKIDSSFPDH